MRLVSKDPQKKWVWNRKSYVIEFCRLYTVVTLLQPRREETLAWFFLLSVNRLVCKVSLCVMLGGEIQEPFLKNL
jgi:hypothetical protein